MKAFEVFMLCIVMLGEKQVGEWVVRDQYRRECMHYIPIVTPI